MRRSVSWSSGRVRSMRSPFDLAARAASAKRGLMDLATSSAVVPFGNSLVLPSGSLRWMLSDMVKPCILLNLLSLSFARVGAGALTCPVELSPAASDCTRQEAWRAALAWDDRGRPVPTSSLFLRGSWRGMQSFDCGLYFCRNRIRIAQGQTGGGDGRTDPHLQRLAFDVVGVHGQQVEGADERDGHDLGLRFDGEKECARQKRLNPAIPGAAAFGKDDQRHAVAQAPQRGLDGADRSRRVLLVDADLSRTLQMPADEWVREQFTFENDAELRWQIDIEDRNVERRCMRDRIHAGFGLVDLFLIHACHCHRRQDRLHDEPRPEAGAIVLDAPVALEERADQRKRAQNQGVSPDQRVKNEIGAQAAKPAMPAFVLNCRPRLSPRRDSRSRLSSRAQLGSLFFRLRSCGDLVQDSLSKLLAIRA